MKYFENPLFPFFYSLQYFFLFFFKAIFTYWFTSNVLSLVQVGVLKIPGVKEYLGIPPPLPQPKADPNVKPGTFMENLRAGT